MGRLSVAQSSNNLNNKTAAGRIEVNRQVVDAVGPPSAKVGQRPFEATATQLRQQHFAKGFLHQPSIFSHLPRVGLTPFSSTSRIYSSRRFSHPNPIRGRGGWATVNGFVSFICSGFSE